MEWSQKYLWRNTTIFSDNSNDFCQDIDPSYEYLQHGKCKTLDAITPFQWTSSNFCPFVFHLTDLKLTKLLAVFLTLFHTRGLFIKMIKAFWVYRSSFWLLLPLRLYIGRRSLNKLQVSIMVRYWWVTWGHKVLRYYRRWKKVTSMETKRPLQSEKDLLVLVAMKLECTYHIGTWDILNISLDSDTGK